LQEYGLTEVRTEIETAASAPLMEEGTPEDDARISRLVRSEVGRGAIRRKRPNEVFASAIAVLQSRLVELPAVADGIVGHLRLAATRIEFRVDYEEEYAPRQSEVVRLDRLALNSEEAALLHEATGRLGIGTGRVGTD
jgi:hypothetical protein